MVTTRQEQSTPPGDTPDAGYINAFDLNTLDFAWRNQLTGGQAVAGVMSTAGGLVAFGNDANRIRDRRCAHRKTAVGFRPWTADACVSDVLWHLGQAVLCRCRRGRCVCLRAAVESDAKSIVESSHRHEVCIAVAVLVVVTAAVACPLVVIPQGSAVAFVPVFFPDPKYPSSRPKSRSPIARRSGETPAFRFCPVPHSCGLNAPRHWTAQQITAA